MNTSTQSFAIVGVADRSQVNIRCTDITTDVFYCRNFKTVIFKNLTIHTGKYGLYIRNALVCHVENCVFYKLGSSTSSSIHNFANTQAQQLTGPTAFQAYMSPFQQDVIDTTLAEFDRQAAKGLPALSAQAIQAGAFGGGREGVQRAEFQAQSDRNRAALQAQLLQTGFGQAQNLAQQDFMRNINLAQQTPALLGQQISALTGLGAQQAARAQQELTAQQQLASRQALQPLEAAQQFGSGVTSLIAGYPGRDVIQPAAATPSPLATGLGTASTLAGIYRLINPPAQNINLSRNF